MAATDITAQAAFTEVSDLWKWKTAKEGDIHPRDMRTSHLFYTFRMIWNNHAPRHARVGKVKLYRFGPEYTPQYFKEAIRFMGGELARRDDLDDWQVEELNEMARHFSHRIEQ